MTQTFRDGTLAVTHHLAQTLERHYSNEAKRKAFSLKATQTGREDLDECHV